jgi:predicted dehydrogenase
MARTIEEAHDVARAARSSRVPLMVGMNLRFAPFYRRLKQLVSDGAIGTLISIEWKEVLSAAAWADGYCRSSWYSRKCDVGGWLLEKSCHDIDQINWLVDAPCTRVASFGSRGYFRPRDDVPERCSDACPVESTCYFSCHRLHPDGPGSLPTYVPPERWDLCVYHSGSDLVDRQVAILEYDNHVTAAFSLLPVGSHWERLMRICGSEGTVRGSDSRNEIRIHRHNRTEPTVEVTSGVEGGHGGADPGVIGAFLSHLEDPSIPIAVTVEQGLESMLAAGAIETACAERRVVELAPLREGGRIRAFS